MLISLMQYLLDDAKSILHCQWYNSRGPLITLQLVYVLYKHAGKIYQLNPNSLFHYSCLYGIPQYNIAHVIVQHTQNVSFNKRNGHSNSTMKSLPFKISKPVRQPRIKMILFRKWYHKFTMANRQRITRYEH